LKKAAENKWLIIRFGFIAVFVIVIALIVFGKVSEYNENKDVVTASLQVIDTVKMIGTGLFKL